VRKIAATYIFTPQNELIKNGILVCEDDGTIIELQKSNKNIAEQSGLEYYSGILVPGFVNTHCHLELSHFNNKIEENCGISSFLEQVNRLRKLKPDKSEILLHHFDRKMWASGIAAVGDISNSTDTLIAKQKSKIYYHTFIETFGFHPSRAERAYEIALKVKEEFDFNGLSNSIVPHSAHSVSKPLFSKIIEHAHNYNSIISIHNQESSAENLFFKSGSGPIVDYFQNTLNLDISHWKPTGKSSCSQYIY
jgi:cytosine/adenosine deaminase-related metal-dependent hydrolase